MGAASCLVCVASIRAQECSPRVLNSHLLSRQGKRGNDEACRRSQGTGRRAPTPHVVCACSRRQLSLFRSTATRRRAPHLSLFTTEQSKSTRRRPSRPNFAAGSVLPYAPTPARAPPSIKSPSQDFRFFRPYLPPLSPHSHLRMPPNRTEFDQTDTACCSLPPLRTQTQLPATFGGSRRPYGHVGRVG